MKLNMITFTRKIRVGGLGTSRNLDGMVKVHTITANMIKLTDGIFLSIQLVRFLIQLLMLMRD